LSKLNDGWLIWLLGRTKASAAAHLTSFWAKTSYLGSGPSALRASGLSPISNRLAITVGWWILGEEWFVWYFKQIWPHENYSRF
jgi:hypothetical protein